MCWPFDGTSFGCGAGAGCGPCNPACYTLQPNIPVIDGSPAILAAQMARATSSGDSGPSLWWSVPWLSSGDVLTLTLGAPVAGEPRPDDFDIMVGVEGELDACERHAFIVQPHYVTLQPADEANERNTIFIVGDFTHRPSSSDYGDYSNSVAPIAIAIKSLDLTVAGSRQSLNNTCESSSTMLQSTNIALLDPRVGSLRLSGQIGSPRVWSGWKPVAPVATPRARSWTNPRPHDSQRNCWQ